jgi:hypothetical protein
MRKTRIVRNCFIALSILAIAAAASAQEKRVEINPFFGYSFSDGVTVDPFILGGNVYDAVNAESGMVFGVHFGVFATENMEIGFQWARQDSKLEAKNGRSEELTDMNIDNYHAIFTYNWFDEDAVARPFLFGGLGATNFSPADIGGVSVDGETQFSGTWGGGVKVSGGQSDSPPWPVDPNYVSGNPAGVWCSPTGYGCYVVNDAGTPAVRAFRR